MSRLPLLGLGVLLSLMWGCTHESSEECLFVHCGRHFLVRVLSVQPGSYRIAVQNDMGDALYACEVPVVGGEQQPCEKESGRTLSMYYAAGEIQVRIPDPLPRQVTVSVSLDSVPKASQSYQPVYDDPSLCGKCAQADAVLALE